MHLSQIQSPEVLKDMNLDQLEVLCREMRSALVEKVLDSGGHLGSNLGVVELVVALHRAFDLKRDRIVFDVSHQCYPHKMLTGRYARFDTLRKTGGLSGFCNRQESPEYDMLTAGHAGTAISFAHGLAEGMRGSGRGEEGDPWSIAFVGDAGFGAGVSFEGLTQAAESKARMLVILNDNEWSIAKSVGALARYLSRIRSSRTLNKVYERLHNLAGKLPGVGARIDELGEVIRHVMIPGHVFEELGVNYIGPLDGHDIELVTTSLERARRLEGPILLHFLTEKGRGYAPAAADPERAHGVAPTAKVPSPIAAEARAKVPERKSYTAIFGDEMCKLGKEDARVQAITAGMCSGTGLNAFSKAFPDRFHDTGITEQHAVAMAGGLATAGKRPVVAIYSTFLQRAYDQVFQEVALQRESVIFAMDRAGLVGQDGPTHQGLYDLAYLRAFPGITQASPRDEVDLRRMLRAGLERGRPWALRWPRGMALACLGPEAEMRPELEPGTAERMRIGKHGAVLALGAMVENALLAADLMAQQHGIELEVWDARFSKPVDTGVIADLARRHKWLATVEEHSEQGGFGSAVLETLADLNLQPQVHRSAVPDRFVEHMSSRDEQLELCKLSPTALLAAWMDSIAPHVKHSAQSPV
ncbi:MAG: 1-deoxy-D-xylulose-5-phosphate synthase [Planctomycetes bacterium]|nr:1-deoxy-D-xylulose-5-phosphate synthase [Planctomycetota bacterium]